MVKMLIQMNPELKRCEETTQDLEARNMFKTEIYEVQEPGLDAPANNPFMQPIQPRPLFQPPF